MFKFTLINILIIEISFFIFERIVRRRNTFYSFFTTIFICLIILYFSFGGAVSQIFQKMAMTGNKFNLFDILMVFFNMFYGYARGLSRIAKINKKYGHIDEI